MKRFFIRVLPVVLLTLFAVGCSTMEQQVDRQPAPEPAAEVLISQDFVNVMVQIDRLSPGSTTLQFNRDNTATGQFNEIFRKTLMDAGYGIQLVPNNQGERYVSYNIEQKSDDLYSYQVYVGDFGMRREYKTAEQGGVKPATSMLVKGADATRIHLTNELFDPLVENKIIPDDKLLADNKIVTESTTSTDKQIAADNKITSENHGSTTTAKLATGASAPQAEVITAAVEMPAAPMFARSDAATVTDAPGAPKYLENTEPRLVDAAFPTVARARADRSSLTPVQDVLALAGRQNMRDLGESNFNDLLAQYDDVRESILTFKNDSMRLGNDNKQRVQQFVEMFNPESDVFSVIGCSHGHTNLKNGNAALALGRAHRIKEALMFSGVPDTLILDEGCWDGQYFDEKMPRRGVVLTLKRRAG